MLVSVVTPSRARRAFIPRLLHQFQLQDWEEKELIIVASGEPIEDLVPRHPHIRVYRQDVGAIGAALNLGIQKAKGQVVIRFDDDDWQARSRIGAQVGHLQVTGRAVVGMCSYVQYAEGRPHGWRVYDRMMHSAGAFLAFDRQWALDHPFADGRGVAEDSIFVTEAIEADEYSAISGLDISVLSLHGYHDSGRKDPELSQSAEYIASSDCMFKVPYEKIAHIVEGRPAEVSDEIDPDKCPTCGGPAVCIANHETREEEDHYLCCGDAACGSYRLDLTEGGANS